MALFPGLALSVLLACAQAAPEPAAPEPAAPEPAAPEPAAPESADIEALAARIRVLQDGRTDGGDEAAIRDLLLSVKGDELGALKAALDGGWSYKNLHHLVFSDIDDPVIRAEILEHIRAHQPPRPSPPSAAIRVISDIDDTVVASWIDARYPSGAVYPGALPLVREIASGPPIFISARPGDRLGLVERYTHEALAALGVTRATLLAGDFVHLTSDREIAEKKLRNFQEYSQLYPEALFVFFGDSGQGDILLGERMIAGDAGRVLAVFIHDVVDDDGDKPRLDEAERLALAEVGITVFDSYLEAALGAHRRGMIDQAALGRVADASKAALDTIAFEDDATRAARRGELDAATARIPPAR